MATEVKRRPYAHPVEVMTLEEVHAWAECFRRHREAGTDMDETRPTALWQVEGLVATIQHLLEGKPLPQGRNTPSATVSSETWTESDHAYAEALKSATMEELAREVEVATRVTE